MARCSVTVGKFWILPRPRLPSSLLVLFLGKVLDGAPMIWCHSDKRITDIQGRHPLNLQKVDIERQADKPNTSAQGFPML